MKKEVLFAIIVGFIIGLIITFGIYRAQQAYKQSVSLNSTEQTPSPTPVITMQNDTSHRVIVDEPLNQAVVLSESVTIRGKTTPNSYVTVVSESDEEIIQADDNGTFITPFLLESGINILTVTALTATQESAATEVTVIYQVENIVENNETAQE